MVSDECRWAALAPNDFAVARSRFTPTRHKSIVINLQKLIFKQPTIVPRLQMSTYLPKRLSNCRCRFATTSADHSLSKASTTALAVDRELPGF